MRRSHSTVACRWAISASRTIKLATADQGCAAPSRSSNDGGSEVLLEPVEAGLLLLVGQLDQPRQVARLRERELEVELLAHRRHRGAGRHPVLEAFERRCVRRLVDHARGAAGGAAARRRRACRRPSPGGRGLPARACRARHRSRRRSAARRGRPAPRSAARGRSRSHGVGPGARGPRTSSTSCRSHHLACLVWRRNERRHDHLPSGDASVPQRSSRCHRLPAAGRSFPHVAGKRCGSGARPALATVRACRGALRSPCSYWRSPPSRPAAAGARRTRRSSPRRSRAGRPRPRPSRRRPRQRRRRRPRRRPRPSRRRPRRPSPPPRPRPAAPPPRRRRRAAVHPQAVQRRRRLRPRRPRERRRLRPCANGGEAWFAAVHGGASPASQITAAGYTCNGALDGERADVDVHEQWRRHRLVHRQPVDAAPLTRPRTSPARAAAARGRSASSSSAGSTGSPAEGETEAHGHPRERVGRRLARAPRGRRA